MVQGSRLQARLEFLQIPIPISAHFTSSVSFGFGYGGVQVAKGSASVSGWDILWQYLDARKLLIDPLSPTHRRWAPTVMNLAFGV